MCRLLLISAKQTAAYERRISDWSSDLCSSDLFLLLRLPQPPDDLKGGVGLAGAGGHDQQNAILPTSDGLNSAIYGIGLVVTRHAPRAVVVVRRLGLLMGLTFQALTAAIALPEFSGAGELDAAQLRFDLYQRAGAIMDK